MSRNVLCVLFVAVMLTLGLSAMANADVLCPTAVSGVNDYSGNSFTRLIPGGAGDNLDTTFVSAGDVSTWYQASSAGGAGMSLSNGGALPTYTFTLASPATLSGAYLWNNDQWGGGGGTEDLTNRGVKGYDILTSTDGATFTSVSGGVGYQLAKCAFGANAATQWQAFAPTQAKYVQIAATSSWGSNYVGLSEVRFEGTASTPEPSTIVLLMTGLVGLIAYAWRKKQ